MENTEQLFFGSDFNMRAESPINFIETRLNDLSPFSAHEIKVDGEIFKTIEHAYQALRIKPGVEREAIKKAKSPMDAWREGQKYKNIPSLCVKDYDKDALMEKLFRIKLEQHPDIRKVLKVTNNRELLKVHDLDVYWGTGKDGKGENKMGKIWMKLRDELYSND